MENIEKLVSPERKIPQKGIYEHYKSTPEDRRYYQVLGAARQSETGEELVIYIPLYETGDNTDLQFTARPLTMFTEEVELNGKIVPRFRYIGPEL